MNGIESINAEARAIQLASERDALGALAREAGELMMVLHPECEVGGCPMNDFYAKLRAAGLLKGGE